ncbi:hypothetical protein N309_15728, partial [Tinamus guttatus]
TGSAGVDIALAVDAMLTDSSVQCLPSTTCGPLEKGSSALLLGCSSVTRKGHFVLPGVIDADFTGTIHVMVRTPSPPIHVPAGEKIAQLVPFFACVPKSTSKVRGKQGFGSTGTPEIHLAMDISKRQPMEQVTLKHPCGHQTSIPMLVETEADVTIVS